MSPASSAGCSTVGPSMATAAKRIVPIVAAEAGLRPSGAWSPCAPGLVAARRIVEHEIEAASQLAVESGSSRARGAQVQVDAAIAASATPTARRAGRSRCGSGRPRGSGRRPHGPSAAVGLANSASSGASCLPMMTTFSHSPGCGQRRACRPARARSAGTGPCCPRRRTLRAA